MWRRACTVLLLFAPLLVTGCGEDNHGTSPDDALERCELVPLELRHGAPDAYGALPGPFDSDISGIGREGDVECAWVIRDASANKTCPDGATALGPSVVVNAVVRSDDSYVITRDEPAPAESCD
jgi:hypothetical protein